MPIGGNDADGEARCRAIMDLALKEEDFVDEALVQVF